ncbi:hypothetical protein SASPL_146213 [Salvia splendens]|uniref:Uncharacterized protein n=1 Tax=Salvia splendens TaxID=180675 RepID=A0A8X8WDF1_SALSN|nr:hypothetical protein SASPL_146213 [Salvia splendens]
MSESDPQIDRNQKPSARPPKISSNGGGGSNHPNPRETGIPDAATLRDQWRFAIRQYSRWYSQAWGTAILAGVSFFALAEELHFVNVPLQLVYIIVFSLFDLAGTKAAGECMIHVLAQLWEEETRCFDDADNLTSFKQDSSTFP